MGKGGGAGGCTRGNGHESRNTWDWDFPIVLFFIFVLIPLWSGELLPEHLLSFYHVATLPSRRLLCRRGWGKVSCFLFLCFFCFCNWGIRVVLFLLLQALRIPDTFLDTLTRAPHHLLISSLLRMKHLSFFKYSIS